jgi:hypothetical protein
MLLAVNAMLDGPERCEQSVLLVAHVHRLVIVEVVEVVVIEFAKLDEPGIGREWLHPDARARMASYDS